MELLLLIPGFMLLIGGAEWLIGGSSHLAKRLGVSELQIGLTVVAFGTSLPELIINVMAQDSGASDLAIGNVIGSNITNTLLILGLAAMIRNLTVHRTVVNREVVFNVLVSGMVLVLAADHVTKNASGFRGLDFTDGLVLISYFVIFLYYIYNTARSRESAKRHVKSHAVANLPRAFWFVVAGAVAVSLGGRWVVDGAVEIATIFGLSEALIGVTIVAVGTSLPELVTSISAVRKGQVDIAIGNVLGSNLFNLMWVLGFSATLGDLPFTAELFSDTVFMLGVAGVLLLMLVFGRVKHQLSRFEGRLLLLMYVVYVVVASWESIAIFN